MMRAECQRCRELMDSYVSNELLVETNLDVIRHLEGCAECRAHAEARRRTRELLRDGVRAEHAPQALHDGIAVAIASETPVRRRSYRVWPFRRALLGAAAVVFVVLLAAPGTRAWMESAAKAVIGAVTDRFSHDESPTPPSLPPSAAPSAPAPVEAPVAGRPLKSTPAANATTKSRMLRCWKSRRLRASTQSARSLAVKSR
jgi:anti-sigma factor RsiW